MLEEGLVEVDTEVHARSWPGGTPGALLPTITLAHLRDDLGASFSAEELSRVDQLLRHPRLVVRNIPTYSTIGRRPAPPQPNRYRNARPDRYGNVMGPHVEDFNGEDG